MVMIEHRVVQVLLGREVAENDGFRDAGRGGDFLGGGASVSFAGEEVERRLHELAAAVAGGEAEGLGTEIVHRLHCKSVLTYSQVRSPRVESLGLDSFNVWFALALREFWPPEYHGRESLHATAGP